MYRNIAEKNTLWPCHRSDKCWNPGLISMWHQGKQGFKNASYIYLPSTKMHPPTD